VPKPVIHGSDAHELARLFKPVQNKYCWIKADPTFEGLRQVLHEPEDRVWIGEAPPSTHEARSVLNQLTVSTSNGWFEDDRTIPLNSGMVAIIGLKGSGKTALADMIRFAGGAKLDDENSFLSRAQEHIVDLAVLLQWKNGTKRSRYCSTLTRRRVRVVCTVLITEICRQTVFRGQPG